MNCWGSFTKQKRTWKAEALLEASWPHCKICNRAPHLPCAICNTGLLSSGTGAFVPRQALGQGCSYYVCTPYSNVPDEQLSSKNKINLTMSLSSYLNKHLHSWRKRKKEKCQGIAYTCAKHHNNQPILYFKESTILLNTKFTKRCKKFLPSIWRIWIFITSVIILYTKRI